MRLQLFGLGPAIMYSWSVVSAYSTLFKSSASRLNLFLRLMSKDLQKYSISSGLKCNGLWRFLMPSSCSKQVFGFFKLWMSPYRFSQKVKFNQKTVALELWSLTSRSKQDWKRNFYKIPKEDHSWLLFGIEYQRI